MKAYKIDSKAQAVTEIQVHTLEDLQAAVGGYIETAANLANGDMLFVDEEGRYKGYTTGFDYFDSNLGPFVGDGIIVGHAGSKMADVKISLDKAQRFTRFLKIGR